VGLRARAILARVVETVGQAGVLLPNRALSPAIVEVAERLDQPIDFKVLHGVRTEKP